MSSLQPELDPPEADINAVGVRERAFPIKLLLIGAAVLLAIVAALLFWFRSAAPFSTSKKEELPTAAAPASVKPLPKITPLDGTPQTNGVTPSTSGSERVSVPAVVGTGSQKGTADCPLTVLIDNSTGKPVIDPATGQPMSVDCKGVAIGPQAQGAGTGVNRILASSKASRYAGDVLLGKQPGNLESAPGVGVGAGGGVPSIGGLGSAGSRASGMPQMPPPPAALATIGPLLEKLTSQIGGGSPAPSGGGGALPIPQGQGGATPNSQAGVNSGMLNGLNAKSVLAAKTIDETLTIPKGTQIDCALTTRVVTEISGFANCIVTDHVYSANGRTLLIEKMSEVEGEYASNSMQAGQRSLHILWTRLRKPGGVTIELASPASDGLGGAGLAGHVDNRWAERIGGAYMLSLVKDLITYKTAVDAPAGGSSYLNNTTQQTNSIAEKVLASTINIRPVLFANQGARVAIYVARDLDFSKIYVVRARQQ